MRLLSRIYQKRPPVVAPDRVHPLGDDGSIFVEVDGAEYVRCGQVRTLGPVWWPPNNLKPGDLLEQLPERGYMHLTRVRSGAYADWSDPVRMEKMIEELFVDELPVGATR